MLLEVRNLNVAYGDAPALWDVSLTIDAGQIVSVVGPNGAGKSTLINTIAGVLRPTSGRLMMAGTDIARVPGHRVCEHGVAVVPEGRRLFTHMSVLENLELGAYARPRSEVLQGVEEVFSLFPILRERKHQVAGSMSGGQQQMVAIGRALMAKPRLLLMDEPSLGLSPAVVDDMFRIIETINQRGVAVLLVEQNIHKALALAHHAYVIEQGRIATSGAPQVLLNTPRIQEAYLGV
jgi:branched-chain amino acid transport system ATP-binding protein